jgi:hypothetical protein
VEWITVRIQVYAASAISVEMAANNQEFFFWVPEPVSTQWQRETSSTLPGINPRSAYPRLGTVHAAVSELH